MDSMHWGPHPRPCLTCPSGILSKRRGDMDTIAFAEKGANV